MRFIFLLWVLIFAGGCSSLLLELSRPEIRMVAGAGTGLSLIIVGVIIFAGLVCFGVIWLIDRFGASLMDRSSRFRVAWHLLRSQRDMMAWQGRFALKVESITLRSRPGALAGLVALFFGVWFACSKIPPWTPNPLDELLGLRAGVWSIRVTVYAGFATLLVCCAVVGLSAWRIRRRDQAVRSVLCSILLLWLSGLFYAVGFVYLETGRLGDAQDGVLLLDFAFSFIPICSVWILFLVPNVLDLERGLFEQSALKRAWILDSTTAVLSVVGFALFCDGLFHTILLASVTFGGALMRFSVVRGGGARRARLFGDLWFLLCLLLPVWAAFEPNQAGAINPVWTLFLLAGSGLFYIGLQRPILAINQSKIVGGAGERRLRLTPFKVVRRRRFTVPTFIATVGIAVGVWALIVVLSVMKGFGEDLEEKLIRVDAHVHVESERLDQPLPLEEKLHRQILSDKAVQTAHRLVIGRAMITTRVNTSSSVDIKGVDPTRYGDNELLSGVLDVNVFKRLLTPELYVPDFAVRESDQAAQAGRLSEDGFTAPTLIFPGIILGTELADSLQVRVGDTVQMVAPDGDDTPFGVRPRSRTFRVVAMFRTGMYQYDLRMAYISFAAGQDFFDLPEGANRIEVVLKDRNDSSDFRTRYTQQIQSDRVTIRSWDTMNAALLSALELERIAMFLVLGFIVLVASFNIVGSLVMIIMEKAGEISILRAMGSSAKWMSQVFLIVGSFIGVVGIGTGLLLGLGSCIWLSEWGVEMPREYYVEKMPVVVEPATLVAVILVAVALVFFSTLIPARRVRHFAPAEGLRHE